MTSRDIAPITEYERIESYTEIELADWSAERNWDYVRRWEARTSEDILVGSQITLLWILEVMQWEGVSDLNRWTDSILREVEGAPEAAVERRYRVSIQRRIMDHLRASGYRVGLGRVIHACRRWARGDSPWFAQNFAETPAGSAILIRGETRGRVI